VIAVDRRSGGRRRSPEATFGARVDRETFESIVEQNYARVLRSALVLTGNAWEAEDLAQETFLEACRSRGRFAGRSQVGTWLHAILFNLHRRRLRSGQRRKKRWLTWFARFSKSTVQAADHAVELEEWRNSVWAAVAALPELQRYAIVLRYADGATYEEISEVLGCPVGTAKSRVHHGLVALQKKFAGRTERVADELPAVSRWKG
jgi:RNA polymerase sigma-70 factor (ECF subfamily)